MLAVTGENQTREKREASTKIGKRQSTKQGMQQGMQKGTKQDRQARHTASDIPGNAATAVSDYSIDRTHS